MEKTTRGLSKVLERITDAHEAEEFIRSNTAASESLSSYLNSYIGNHGLRIPDIILDSGINQNYAYNILNGHKNPSRDKIIAICIGCHMNYSEVQHALELAGLAPLYPKDERDARIAIAINRKVKNTTELNLILEQYSLKVLNI